MLRCLPLLLPILVLTGPASASPVDDPLTVVRVEGNARDGFGIHYLGGTSSYPPTGSEARAECSEYDARVDRVRCRTEVRTWFRDLAVLRDALRYARAEANGP